MGGQHAVLLWARCKCGPAQPEPSRRCAAARACASLQATLEEVTEADLLVSAGWLLAVMGFRQAYPSPSCRIADPPPTCPAACAGRVQSGGAAAAGRRAARAAGAGAERRGAAEPRGRGVEQIRPGAGRGAAARAAAGGAAGAAGASNGSRSSRRSRQQSTGGGKRRDAAAAGRDAAAGRRTGGCLPAHGCGHLRGAPPRPARCAGGSGGQGGLLRSVLPLCEGDGSILGAAETQHSSIPPSLQLGTALAGRQEQSRGSAKRAAAELEHAAAEEDGRLWGAMGRS